VTRDELILRTRTLVADGERIERTPSMESLRTWLAESDLLLAEAWGQMDRYHLVWLSVGHPRDAVRDRAMTEEEEEAYVREIAVQKTAALRMSLDAVERHGMPFVGEDAPVRGAPPDRDVAADAAIAGARGERPAEGDPPEPGGAGGQIAADRADLTGAIRATGPGLAERIREARERTLSSDPSVVRRAPNPERMRR
jgi:hypothetical protein